MMWLWPRRKGRQTDEEGHLFEIVSSSTQKESSTKYDDASNETQSKIRATDNDSSQAQADGWKEAHDRFKKLDDATMREYSEEVDTVLVFAGLFSAILTAFIVEVYQGLQEDYVKTSAQLLLRISMQLENSTQALVPLPPSFPHHPDATTIAVNMLWFSSLILSLFAALLGILVKQWLHVYTKWPEREQPKDTVILRYIYQEGFFRWRVPGIIGLLPVLLQVALLLFVVGLVTYMWTLNFAIAGVLSVLVTVMILVAVVTIALPFFSGDCPYKSPVGLVIAALKAKYVDGSPSSDLSSWQRRDLSKAKPYLEFELSNDVIAQSGLLLDLAPRGDLESALDRIIDNNSLLGSRISGLPNTMLRLLLDLVIASTKDELRSTLVTNHTHRALHILEYISRNSVGDIRQDAIEAVIYIVNSLENHLSDGLHAVGSMIQRYSKGKQLNTSMAWRCALAIHSWGTNHKPESETTVRTCLSFIGAAADALLAAGSDELHLAVQTGSYDAVLDALQFWIQSALRTKNLHVMKAAGEKQFRKLFDHYRAHSTRLLSLGGHCSWVTSVAFSPDGLWVVSGSLDKIVRVWDSRTGASVSAIEGHTEPVSCVAFSPDGSHIASGAWDKTVRVWDLSTGASVTVFEGHTEWVNSIAFSPDGSRIISGSNDKVIRVWDMRTGAIIAILEGHTKPVKSVAFSLDGLRVLSGSADTTVRMWDSQTGESVALLKGHTESVRSVAFSPDSLRIVSGSSDRTVRVWDAQTLENLVVYKSDTDRINSVAFSYDGSRIISSSDDKLVHVLDSHTGATVAVIEGHTKSVTSVALSPICSRIVSGSNDKTVRVWDPETGMNLAVFEGHEDCVTSVAFSPDGSRTVSGSNDKTARVWDSQTGKTVAVLYGHTKWINSVAFSPDGLRIASGSNDRTVRVWNSQTGANVAVVSGHSDWVNSVAFSPNGSYIASGSFDKTVRICDSQTGINVAVLRGHRSQVTSVTFSRDGSYIISSDMFGDTRIWNAHTYLPTLRALEDIASPSELTFEFTFERGWLLCKRPKDTFARRLRPITDHHTPSTPVVVHGNTLAYGTNKNNVVHIDFSAYS